MAPKPMPTMEPLASPSIGPTPTTPSKPAEEPKYSIHNRIETKHISRVNLV